jgi:glutathione synthase/RimK-type ligase-like ATP-grasp enzyme
MILLVGDHVDPHLLRVAQELTALGVASRLVNFGDLGQSAAVELQLSSRGRRSWRLIGEGWTVASDDITASWVRRRRHPSVISAVPDPDDRSFARNEWRATLDGLLSLLNPKSVVNAQDAEAASRSKIRQLDIAQQLGFAIPDTLVTSSSDAARAFVERHDRKVIHKALTAPTHWFIETRRWQQDDDLHLELLSLGPIVLQEEISGAGDIRVTVAGENVFAALIPPSPTAARLNVVDSRLDVGKQYETYACSDLFADQIRKLCAVLGLAICTLDFKLLASGELVFFEVNPQGQFLYVEIMTRQSIAKAVAATLVSIAGRGHS